MGNSLIGIGGIDLETFSPLPSVEGMGMAGGYGGPGMKPVALRLTAEIAAATGLPVLGVGGILSWRDAVEYLAVGAHAVQLCSAVMWEGFDIIHKLTRGLEEYLERRQFRSPADIVGKALPRLKRFPDLNLQAQRVAYVEPEQCNGCAICIRSCECGGYQAITMSEIKKAFVDVHACGGCGLCVGVCPTGGILMVPKDSVGER
jgi:dihydropyrimidine dehydrogenase (NAD+) subunit PreA